MKPGGMAQVWRARRIGAAGFSKEVCIKRIHEQNWGDAAVVGLFKDEAFISAKLRHRNIVSIDALHDGRADKNREFFFIVMEFVNGVNLRELEDRATSAG